MLIFPILANAQTGESIFEITDDGEIITKSKFIDSLTYNRSSLDWFWALDFKLTYPINVKLLSSIYAIRMGELTENITEGDSHLIEFFKNGKQILLFKELEGIVKTDNDYFVIAPLSDSSKLLIFEGYQYGADLPRLIIFVLSESDVKLVYYKYRQVGKIINTSKKFYMTIVSNRAEWSYDRKTIESPAVTHTIWREDGVLKFKDD